jgi:hypothetical protein
MPFIFPLFKLVFSAKLVFLYESTFLQILFLSHNLISATLVFLYESTFLQILFLYHNLIPATLVFFTNVIRGRNRLTITRHAQRILTAGTETELAFGITGCSGFLSTCLFYIISLSLSIFLSLFLYTSVSLCLSPFSRNFLFSVSRPVCICHSLSISPFSVSLHMY